MSSLASSRIDAIIVCEGDGRFLSLLGEVVFGGRGIQSKCGPLAQVIAFPPSSIRASVGSLQRRLETLSDYREVVGIGDLDPASNNSIDGESDGELVPGFKTVRVRLCIPSRRSVEKIIRGVVELFSGMTEKTAGFNRKDGKEIERGLPMSEIQLAIRGYGQVHDGEDPGGCKYQTSCGSGRFSVRSNVEARVV